MPRAITANAGVEVVNNATTASGFAAVAAAQTTSTEILGTITDPSGAVVVGAKISLLRVATGERSLRIVGVKRKP